MHLGADQRGVEWITRSPIRAEPLSRSGHKREAVRMAPLSSQRRGADDEKQRPFLSGRHGRRSIAGVNDTLDVLVREGESRSGSENCIEGADVFDAGGMM
jgi:hypothetical protein